MRYPDIVCFLLFCTISLLGAGNASAGERSGLKGEKIQPAAMYHNYCSVCHGDRGDGNSRARRSLIPPPRDFTAGGEMTRDTMISIITYGKPGTAMVGWKTQLTQNEIEALADYIRRSFMIVAIDPRLQRGKALYLHNCAACHGERGQVSPRQPARGTLLPHDLSSPQSRARLSRERMIDSATDGHSGATIGDLVKRLSPQDVEAVVDYVRTAIMTPASDDISGVRAHGGRSSDAPPSTPNPAPKVPPT